MFSVRVQSDDFDIATEQSLLVAKGTNIGAVVTFTGLCRDEAGTLAALELEHYPGMAEDEMSRVLDEAKARWPLDGATLIHRFGKIAPGGNIVLVVTASRHRAAAFAAAEFLMDYLKSRAPFWKKEHLKDGTSGAWVDAKETDDAALERWR
ncbi:MAG: molybdenum cofactor biosynthesis protein MoaE [Beijerinckiaceae bacterium]